MVNMVPGIKDTSFLYSVVPEDKPIASPVPVLELKGTACPSLCWHASRVIMLMPDSAPYPLMLGSSLMLGAASL